jgi:hypothetical protein
MIRGVLVATVVWLLLLGTPAGVVATTDTAEEVTLTVSVENQDGEPVKNAELTATWENGSNTETTASNGKAFVDVPAGTEVTIEISHPAYIRNYPTVVENASERTVRIPVSQRGQLTAVVADDAGRVANADVVLRKDGRVAARGTTNDSGVFSSDDVEQGEYTMSVVKPGYYQNTTTVQIDETTETRVAIERGTVSLTVAVRDPHLSPPEALRNATVKIGSVGQFQTLAGGQATVGVPVNTAFSLTVTKDGYETVTETVRVQESDRRVNVSVNRSPSLTADPLNRRVVAGESVIVEVSNEYNESVAGATVLLDDEPVGTTDDDGRVTVSIEEPGNHTLVATTDELRSSRVTITAITAAGETPTATATPTATSSASPTPPETGVGGPGFTVLSAVLALVVGVVILIFRR